jgi:hypothetical protein
MENSEKINEKIILLKEARLQLLRLHKVLIDIERENFEKLNGQITSGQFLSLLLNDENFKWLRKFSTLIVEIDEMLDLDDGFTEPMIDKHLSKMRELLNLKTGDEDFDKKYKNLLQINSEVTVKHSDLKKFLSE